jgi:resuscitation-promoting factor RpfB
VSLETTTTVVPEPVEVPVTEPEVTTSTTVAPPTTTTMAPTTTTTQAPTTTTTTPPPPPPPPPAPPGAPSDGYWDRMAMCETGGNWAHYPNGTYTGGLGIYNGTWLTWGGGEFAPRAGLATREQQIAVANRIAITGHNGVSPVGLSAWGCTAKIGFP